VLKHVDYLRRAELFAGCSDADLAVLADSVRERRVDTGVSILGQGEGAISFFVIADGEVEVTIGGEPVRRLGPGDTFGELALIDDELDTRTAGVTALTPVRLLGLSAWVFRPFLRDHPDVAWAIMQALVRRLREAGERAS